MIKSKFCLNLSRTKLKELGFRYDSKSECYVHKFPVYIYKKQPVIFCKMLVNEEEDNSVWCEICEADDSLYAGYYNEEYGHNNLIEKIDKSILHKLKDLGARRVD